MILSRKSMESYSMTDEYAVRRKEYVREIRRSFDHPEKMPDTEPEEAQTFIPWIFIPPNITDSRAWACAAVCYSVPEPLKRRPDRSAALFIFRPDPPHGG